MPPPLDPERLLLMLRDPDVESAAIAAAAGVPREEAGRAARLLMTMARARPEEVASLPGPLAGAVLCAAATAGRADLVAALCAHPVKDVAKEAKRQVHHLKVRGVAVPEPARAPAAPPPPAPAEPPPTSYATTPDGHGERAVWLTRNVPGRGVEVAQAVLSDEKGLIELQVGTLGRKEWRTFVKGLVARGGEVGVAEVARERALALVLAARALNDGAGARVPEGTDHWLGQQGATPPPAVADAAPPPDDAADPPALAASGALHDLPILRGWLADEPYLREVAARLDQAEAAPARAEAAPAETPPEDRRARLGALVAEAVEGYFTPARRARLSARLLDVADHLSRSGDAARARQAAACARALAAGRPARDIPFAERLVAKAFPLDGPRPRPASPPAPLIAPAR